MGARIQYIQFTTHYFDFESKKLFANLCRSNDLPKINLRRTENKAKYKAKAMRNEFLKSETKLYVLLLSLLNLIKYMWNKFSAIKHSPNYFQNIKCGVNVE